MFLGSNLPYLFVRCHSFQSFFLNSSLIEMFRNMKISHWFYCWFRFTDNCIKDNTWKQLTSNVYWKLFPPFLCFSFFAFAYLKTLSAVISLLSLIVKISLSLLFVSNIVLNQPCRSYYLLHSWKYILPYSEIQWLWLIQVKWMFL